MFHLDFPAPLPAREPDAPASAAICSISLYINPPFRMRRVASSLRRRITGENKRRFVSLEHDFDLDLVYITPRAQQRVLHAGRLDDAA